MISRAASDKVRELASRFKAIAITGARQSGKTTLVKSLFSSKPYVSLENPDTRAFANDDPRGFLSGFPAGAILDEIQRVPSLFSYLQEILDNSKERGLFILTGSNNFLLQQNISQSLAGRVGYFHLLPFSLQELRGENLLPEDEDALMLKGFYPPVYDQQIPVQDWCMNYIHTYIERDVRQIKSISDLIVFERFMKLLAGRSGQELNQSSLAIETGVDVKTIQSWIGILESSFIIYLLRPHHRNFNKTIVKRPKIYFYDTGILCSLLGIRNEAQIKSHPLRGAIFEGLVLTELVKIRTNAGLPVNLYYWRDKTGHEIDVLIDDNQQLLPIEIKSGKTINREFFRHLDYWCRLSGTEKSMLLYAGDETQNRSSGCDVLNWRNAVMRGI
jgi:predicted AAA+ superfamily ATPase